MLAATDSLAAGAWSEPLRDGPPDWVAAAPSRHNALAATSLAVPWCFTEQEEEHAEAVLTVMAGYAASGASGGHARRLRSLPRGVHVTPAVQAALAEGRRAIGFDTSPRFAPKDFSSISLIQAKDVSP